MSDVSSNDSGAVSKLSPSELYGKRISLTTGGPLHREDAIMMIAEIAALRAQLAEARAEVERLIRERDDYKAGLAATEGFLAKQKAENRSLHETWKHLKAEVERMRPVVEAAIRLLDVGGGESWNALADAVDAYRAASSEQEVEVPEFLRADYSDVKPIMGKAGEQEASDAS